MRAVAVRLLLHRAEVHRGQLLHELGVAAVSRILRPSAAEDCNRQRFRVQHRPHRFRLVHEMYLGMRMRARGGAAGAVGVRIERRPPNRMPLG